MSDCARRRMPWPVISIEKQEESFGLRCETRHQFLVERFVRADQNTLEHAPLSGYGPQIHIGRGLGRPAILAVRNYTLITGQGAWRMIP